jgi:hypothetical protein
MEKIERLVRIAAGSPGEPGFFDAFELGVPIV